MAIYNILFCDDSDELTTIFKETCCPLLYNLTTVPDAKEALKLLEKISYDAIITDYRMPGCNGVELIYKIREIELNERTPIFLLSGYLDKKLKGKLQTLLVEYYEKPLSSLALFKKINNKFFPNRLIPNYSSELVDLFYQSTKKTLATFFSTEPAISTPTISDELVESSYVTSYVNFWGTKIAGNIALLTTKEFNDFAAKSVFGEGYEKKIPEEERSELIGELVNQIAGNIKATFDKLGILCQITLPTTFKGKGKVISFNDDSWVKFRININNRFALIGCRLTHVDPTLLKMAHSEEEEKGSASNVMLW